MKNREKAEMKGKEGGSEREIKQQEKCKEGRVERREKKREKRKGKEWKRRRKKIINDEAKFVIVMNPFLGICTVKDEEEEEEILMVKK